MEEKKKINFVSPWAHIKKDIKEKPLFMEMRPSSGFERTKLQTPRPKVPVTDLLLQTARLSHHYSEYSNLQDSQFNRSLYTDSCSLSCRTERSNTKIEDESQLQTIESSRQLKSPRDMVCVEFNFVLK